MPDVSLDLAAILNGQTADATPVKTAFQLLAAAINDLDHDNLAAAAGILDSQLASPGNAVWRTVRSQPFVLPGGSDARTWLFAADGTPVANGFATDQPLLPFYQPASDFGVGGKTVRGRLVAQTLANTVAPGTGLAFGMFPVFSLGGGVSTSIVPSVTGAVAGATTSIGPAAGQAERAVSAAFTMPSAAAYLLGLVLSGATAANSLVVGTIDLQLQNS